MDKQWIITKTHINIILSISIISDKHMGMDQYLLIPCLGEWTSIYQLFWCELQGYKVLTHPHIIRKTPAFSLLRCIPGRWGAQALGELPAGRSQPRGEHLATSWRVKAMEKNGMKWWGNDKKSLDIVGHDREMIDILGYIGIYWDILGYIGIYGLSEMLAGF